MIDNMQPIRDNQQIRCMGVKSVGDQRKQGNLANRLPRKKIRKKKQKQEMSIQNDPPQTDEDATPFGRNRVDKDELPKNESGSILDLEI
ncbi:MAG: hypothetical protein ACUZ77_02775 [Candidatus Brocadiales bacterium]